MASSQVQRRAQLLEGCRDNRVVRPRPLLLLGQRTGVDKT